MSENVDVDQDLINFQFENRIAIIESWKESMQVEVVTRLME